MQSVTEFHTLHAVQSRVGAAIRKVRESFCLKSGFTQRGRTQRGFTQRGRKLTKLSHDKDNPLVQCDQESRDNFISETICQLTNIVQARTKFFRETICQTQITVERLKNSVSLGKRSVLFQTLTQ